MVTPMADENGLSGRLRQAANSRSRRSYLIYEDSINEPELRRFFDAAVQQVQDGTATVRPVKPGSAYPTGFIIDGQGVLDVDVLEYFLGRQNATGFDAGQAAGFAEKMRRLLGWRMIDYTLQQWWQRTVRDQFLTETTGSKYESDQRWVPRPDGDLKDVNPAWLEFGCWIGVGDVKFGYSFSFISANAIFDQVTTLGSDLPAQLRKHGSGQLPADVTSLKTPEMSCAANDAFATIRISVKTESEGNYRMVLEWLCHLLEHDFPRSYGIEFRGPAKTFLPIKGLPKKGVHQLFANAVAYQGLWPLIARYARLAMREFEWYTNIPDEAPAMPGTFAVFALTMADDAYVPLALDYLRTCDGEHQAIQARLVHAYIGVHGFTRNAIAMLLACAGNIQDLPPVRTYPALIANRDALTALLDARTTRAGVDPSAIAALKANLDGRPLLDAEWQGALYTIWGDDAAHHPHKIIAKAPADLRPLYEAILKPPLDEASRA